MIWLAAWAAVAIAFGAWLLWSERANLDRVTVAFYVVAALLWPATALGALTVAGLALWATRRDRIEQQREWGQ